MLAVALRVRAYGRDLTRAKGIMASGACEGRIKGQTHGRTNQRRAEDQTPLANGEPSAHGEPSTHGQLRKLRLTALELREGSKSVIASGARTDLRVDTRPVVAGA